MQKLCCFCYFGIGVPSVWPFIWISSICTVLSSNGVSKSLNKHMASTVLQRFFFSFFLSLLSSAYCEGEVICKVRNKMCRYALIGSSALDGESYFEFICYLWWCRGNNSTASHCFVCGVKAKHSDASRKLGGLNELRWNGSSMLAHIRIS